MDDTTCTLQLVPHTHVDQVWPIVEPMLAKALDEFAGFGEATISQLRMKITDKCQHLIIILKDGGIIGAVTVEFVNFPNKRVAMGTAFGGRGVANMQVMSELKSWCKAMGASEFRTHAKESQARLYARVGMTKQYNVLGVEL